MSKWDLFPDARREGSMLWWKRSGDTEREFFVDGLLGRVHHIDQMTWLTGLAPWEFRFPFSM